MCTLSDNVRKECARARYHKGATCCSKKLTKLRNLASNPSFATLPAIQVAQLFQQSKLRNFASNPLSLKTEYEQSPASSDPTFFFLCFFSCVDGEQLSDIKSPFLHAFNRTGWASATHLARSRADSRPLGCAQWHRNSGCSPAVNLPAPSPRSLPRR
jgi:hypothetical protein